MAIPTPEMTVLKAAIAPENLKVGTGAPPQEVWAKGVLDAKNLTDRAVVKKKLIEGEAVTSNTTSSDIKGIKNKIENIGSDVNPDNGVRIRTPVETTLHDNAKAGIEILDKLTRYETLSPTERTQMKKDVLEVLKSLPGGKELFDIAEISANKTEITDTFIRRHKNEIQTKLQEHYKSMDESGRFDSESASDEVFTKEQERQVKEMEVEQVKTQKEQAEAEAKKLTDRKSEYDTPAAGNRGAELDALSKNETPRLQDIASSQTEMDRCQRKLEKIDEQIQPLEDRIELYKNNPTKAKNDGYADVAKIDATLGARLQVLKDARQDTDAELSTAKKIYDAKTIEQKRFEDLKAEKASLPQSIKNAENEVGQKKIEEAKLRHELKKVANHMRIARENKQMIDEDLAVTTRDLWKNIIKECAQDETKAMLDLIMSPEGLTAFQAELLTELDRKTEEQWTTTAKRIRMGSVGGDRIPAIRVPVIESTKVANRVVIKSKFDAVIGDTTGDTVSTEVKTLITPDKWDALTPEQQRELEAAYVVKLVVRRKEALGMSLRDEEMRALRSGKYGDALIKQGIDKIQDFKDRVVATGAVTQTELANPTPETIQKVKGQLDKDKLLTLLMFGLTPLSMFKTPEQHG